MFRIGSESARWSRAHLRILFVLIEGFSGQRTRSSPIGPAEQDDGGSL